LFERILPWVFGDMQDNGKWRRHHSAIYTKYDTDVVRNARMNRLKLTGYVTRMKDEPIPKRIFFARPERKRWMGRPKMRCLDGVIDSKRITDESNWSREARDRNERKNLLRKARAHPELSNQ